MTDDDLRKHIKTEHFIELTRFVLYTLKDMDSLELEHVHVIAHSENEGVTND